MNTVLVVIDMQQAFVSHHDERYSQAINSVAREIRLARSRGEYIIFVEFFYRKDRQNHVPFITNKTNEELPSLQELIDLVEGYDKVLFVYKKTTDGGTEVVQALREYNLVSDTSSPSDIIRVCGAYTEYCVSETVQTMAMKLKYSRVILVKDALANHGGKTWNDSLAVNYMTSIENVLLEDGSCEPRAWHNNNVELENVSEYTGATAESYSASAPTLH